MNRFYLFLTRIMALTLIALFVPACGKSPAISLPADKQALIGVWQAKQSEFENDVSSDNMLLIFHRDNTVSYVRCINRVNGHSYTKMPNAKLVRFSDDEFEIALDIFITDMNRTFQLDKLPYQANDDWWVTINSVNLRKLKRGEKSDYRNWQCSKDKEADTNPGTDF